MAVRPHHTSEHSQMSRRIISVTTAWHNAAHAKGDTGQAQRMAALIGAPPASSRSTNSQANRGPSISANCRLSMYRSYLQQNKHWSASHLASKAQCLCLRQGAVPQTDLESSHKLGLYCKVAELPAPHTLNQCHVQPCGKQLCLSNNKPKQPPAPLACHSSP